MQIPDREPLISIVVPVYGTEQYFDRCMRSLLGQSYRHLEIIVVNDGSKGDIAERIRPYREDPRVRFVSYPENRGLLRARVCGARAASGEYLAFVDSDDYVSFDFYRTLVKKAEETDADITVGKTVWSAGDEKYIYNYHDASFPFSVLSGEEARQAFFGQEYQCYSWHTVWNKLYKKTLWDKVSGIFARVTRHVVMTEDIFFSSILFYHTGKVAHTENDAYFYCLNENASTDARRTTPERFRRNIEDIAWVFDTVEAYLKGQKAVPYILEGVKGGRQHYARMWRNLAENTFTGAEKQETLAFVDRFCGDTGAQNVRDDYFFESVKTPWNGGLAYLKEKIRDSRQEYISFDIFDTLIKRPFYEPGDLLLLLDETYMHLSGNNISFSSFRKSAEDMARKEYGMRKGFEDVSIDEIYGCLAEKYHIRPEIAERMKKEEIALELKFCRARRAGRELYDLARALGKKVILITDMYLDRPSIEKILSSCGIAGYERLFISCEERALKYNGHLFSRAMECLGISPDNMLHIGDGWKSDVEGSRKASVESIFFPKATEIFENKIQGCATNRCADIGRETCGEQLDYEKARKTLAFRCMQAIAAGLYFDNPYRTFSPESDFNSDPYFIGFYLLGMHLAGLTKWIARNTEGKEHILFLSRDGFLPMKAWEIYRKYDAGARAEAEYVQASRKALLPLMVQDRVNLYQLPVEVRAHSPKTLFSVLYFMADEGKTGELKKELKSAGIEWDRPFPDEESCDTFIDLFVKTAWDREKHKKERDKVCDYYRRLPPDSIAFDMGYSGRIQAAICEAAGHAIDVLFLHEDYGTSGRMKESAGFSICSFYDFHPAVTGLMREHIFSDCGGSCIGFQISGGKSEPVRETGSHIYPDRYVIRSLQRGALDFYGIFMENFRGFSAVMDYSAQEVSIPFEGFLRRPGRFDMRIFSASYFEDMVFGARKSINIEAFALEELAARGWAPKTKAEKEAEREERSRQLAEKKENDRILRTVNQAGSIRRAIAWLVLDPKVFAEKLHRKVKMRKNRM